jgi:uncharacterized protein YjiS (DUF1127 family)
MATVPIEALLLCRQRHYISAVQKGDAKMSIRQKIARFTSYRRTIRELSKLNDRELRDVGLTRGDIDTVARGIAF